MGAVKGTKQVRMVVVPYRPWRTVLLAIAACLVVVAAAGGAYWWGLQTSAQARETLGRDLGDVQAQLSASERTLASTRQELATLKVGGEIDTIAQEEVQATVESLQSEIAQLNEEIRFYKGVMLPNVEEKGLRIERFDVRTAAEPNHYRYSLLLTQVVDKHEYIQGGVEINLLGRLGEELTELPLADVSSDVEKDLYFRFRYFQNLDGDLTVPAGFEPQEIMVVARADGSGGQRLERRFPWRAGEG